ncbi:hypothetical protein F0562_013327 [Nyssa sinensis]|uniref:Uncharacterized protein n=1 Tax=Nyssa sinensis TaxID=561372 RepID=A0A5J4ZPT9_9ASTE|nr:hypothetical protein F0562_013327 [Nyssa sinensis]
MTAASSDAVFSLDSLSDRFRRKTKDCLVVRLAIAVDPESETLTHETNSKFLSPLPSPRTGETFATCLGTDWILRFCLRWIELLDNPRDEGNASRCGENGWHGVGLKQEISEVEVDTKLENPARAKVC